MDDKTTGKKSIRWEDKIFNFILRSRIKHLSKGLNPGDSIFVGDRILRTDIKRETIYIHSNKAYLSRWAIFIMFLAILFCAVILKSGFDMITFAVCLFVMLIFGLLSYAYVLRAKRQATWYVDLNKRVFMLGRTQVPFSNINQIGYSRLIDANHAWDLFKRRSEYSYQLNLHGIRGQYLTLFTCDTYWNIEEAGLFLHQKTGIPLNKKIVNG